jgi:Xaa-Pro aminopeptidase
MIRRLQAILREKNIDAAIVFSWKNKDPNLAYLAGVNIDYSFLVVPKRGSPRLLTSKLEFERARRYSNIKDVRMFQKPAMEHLAKILNRFGPRVGLNKSVASINEFAHIRKNFKGKRYIDIAELLLQMRKTKTGDEIKKLKKACRITDTIFDRLVNGFNFRTEQDILDFLKREAFGFGCSLSFEPIVASGRHSSMPHYRGGNVRLKKGFLTIDFGVDCEGYMSDMTRTIYLGRPSGQEKEMYNVLLAAQKKAIADAKAGTKASILVDSVNMSLGKYAERMIHGLGHGIGVEIHELPSLHPQSKDIIEEGDVFTIEPGIYFENRYGIRIEDDILIQDGRPRVLTHSRKDLITIKR